MKNKTKKNSKPKSGQIDLDSGNETNNLKMAPTIPTPTTSFHDLPVDLLVSILEFVRITELSSPSEVCHDFREAVLELMRRIRTSPQGLHLHNVQITDRILLKLALLLMIGASPSYQLFLKVIPSSLTHHGIAVALNPVALSKLSLSNIKGLADRGIGKFCKFVRPQNLELLEDCGITDTGLKMIANGGKQSPYQSTSQSSDSSIQRLPLRGISLYRMTSVGIDKLLMAIPDIRSISLENCILNDLALDRFATNCTQLEELSVSYPGNFYLNFAKVVRANTNLKKLALRSVKGTEAPNLLGELFSNSKLLESLEITHNLTDACIPIIARHCSKLTSLRMSTTEITEQGVQELFRSPLVQSLTYLNIAFCTRIQNMDSVIGDMARNRSCALQHLDISGNKISDYGLSLIASHASAGFANLGQLRLCKCQHITEKGIIALIGALPDLKLLDLSGCPMMPPQPDIPIPLKKCAPSTLKIVNCRQW